MKNTTILAVCSLILVFSCKDKKDPQGTASYMNMNAGSSWTYESINNTTPAATITYTLLSTSRDTVANGSSYHVFTNSATGASEYYRVSGSDYFTFQKLPDELGGSLVENLYLKTNVAQGTTWSQNYTVTVPGIPIPLSVTLSNTITEKGISKTVNGASYNDVIHTTTAITVALLPAGALTTDIQGYFAPQVGRIESNNKIGINYMGIVSNTDNTIRLKSVSLK